MEASGKAKRINLKTKRIPLKGTCDSSLLDQNMHRVKYPDVREVPLKEEDQKSWLKFKKLDKGRRAITSSDYNDEGKWPLELDHPFVSVIGDFAINAFNKIIEAFVKKDYNNNLRFAEIMDCKYVTVLKRSRLTHFFIMDIEAIEEGILGVYRTSVACYALDGRRTLVHFYLTDSKPTGKIAMKMSRLIFLKSRFKNMKAVKEDLVTNLEKTHKSLQGKKKTGKVAAKLIRLEIQYKDIKGICNMLYRQIRLQTPKAWKERSNRESWCNPSTTEICWRYNGKGYDYYSNFKGFGHFVGVKAAPLLLNRVHDLEQSNRDAKRHF